MTLLFVLACTTDPLADPRFAAPTPGDLVVLSKPEAFRVGQPVVLEATLNPAADRVKRFDAARPSERGRPTTDVWRVSGASETDVSAYWEDHGRALGVPMRLSQGSKQVAVLDVSTEQAFDEPGTYAVQLLTGRVMGEPLILAPVVIEVLPRDPARDAEVLAQALEAVKLPATRDASFREIVALRNPESLAAALAALSEVDPDPWWAVVVHTHPDAAGASQALEQAFEAPDQAVTEQMVEAAVALAYNKRFPVAMHDEGTGSLQEERRTREQALGSIREETVARVAGALPKKTGEARGRTLSALDQWAWQPWSAPWKDAWLEVLRAELEIADPALTERLLRDRWDAVADPALVPALARVAGSDSKAAGMAQFRLLTLDPTRGREEVLAALSRGPITKEVERAVWEWEGLPDPVMEAMATYLVEHPSEPSLVRLLAWFGGRAQSGLVGKAFDALPPDADDAVLGAYGAFFMHTGDPRKDTILAKVGPDHKELFEEIALALRETDQLVPMAFDLLAAHSHEGAAEFCVRVGQVLMRYAPLSAKSKIRAKLETSDGPAEYALSLALYASRNWVIGQDESMGIAPFLEDSRSTAVQRDATLHKPALTLLDFHVILGVPVLKMNWQDYEGVEAIQSKLSQFPPGSRMKVRYTGVSPEAGEAIIYPLITAAGGMAFVYERK